MLCDSLISFELDSFCSSASLISFRARRWLNFEEIVDLSCFTYISLRVFYNIMVICFGYETSPNLIGIQDGYNKNFHKSALNTMSSLILDDCFEI